MAYITFKNIEKKFGNHQVLENINMEVRQGELVTLLGPSGCGKSTLLRCLAGLESVTAGQILLDGKDITNLEAQKRDIGMVFQQYSLFPNLTVAQNIAFGLKQKKVPKDARIQRVKEMAEVVGLSDHLRHYPSELSGGQQQRAALARAMVTHPKVLLLDEPLSAIDALLRRSLQIEIRRIQKEMNITAIFVTHDQDEAMVMSDEIHLMYQGRIEQTAAPTEMYMHPASKFAASFIGHYNILSAHSFEALTGYATESEDVAFRPEIVHMSLQQDERKNIQIKGKVVSGMTHGNILRYTVQCGEEQIDVDVLFDHMLVYSNGTTVYLSLEIDDCIFL